MPPLNSPELANQKTPEAMMKIALKLYFLSVLSLSLAACGGGSQSKQDAPTAQTPQTTPTAETWTWVLPAGVPSPTVPADNAMSEAKFQLGRSLFYDTRLSVNGVQSCASCHRQEQAFTDTLSVSRGATGEFTPRSAQSLANSAWHASYTWARPDLITLEQQMLIPLFAEHPIEMGLTPQNQEDMLTRLRNDAQLPGQFASAFPNESVALTMDNVIKAIASFQRGMVSFDSKYDRSVAGKVELAADAMRGKNLFFSDQARCFRCHGSFNFDDQSTDLSSSSSAFQNTGLYNIDGAGGYPAPNRGLFETTGVTSDMGRFRVASLRNIALTAPYMHDGSIDSLQQVLDFYADGGRVISSGPNAGDGRLNPYKNPLVTGIKLSEQDKLDLIAFLKTLSDESLISNPRFSDPHAPVAH
jgi:cytochrome c peroxidase